MTYQWECPHCRLTHCWLVALSAETKTMLPANQATNTGSSHRACWTGMTFLKENWCMRQIYSIPRKHAAVFPHKLSLNSNGKKYKLCTCTKSCKTNDNLMASSSSVIVSSLTQSAVLSAFEPFCQRKSADILNQLSNQVCHDLFSDVSVNALTTSAKLQIFPDCRFF